MCEHNVQEDTDRDTDNIQRPQNIALTSMILVALSVAARDASLLLSSGGISARHKEAYTDRNALSNFKLLTAKDTTESVGFSMRGK